jgi:hypothetical protein
VSFTAICSKMRSELPGPDRRFVTGGLPVVLRIRDRHGAIRAAAHVALADQPAKLRAIIFLAPNIL